MSDPIYSKRLLLSSKLAIESQDEDGVVVFHTSTYSRLKLSRALYGLIGQFQVPTRVAEVVPEPAHETLLACLANLIEKGFLIPESGEGEYVERWGERRLAVTSHTLFHAPRHQPGEAAADISVVGIPFDLGNGVAAGARRAPTEIRLRSYDYDYRMDFFSGQPMGWFDVEQEERILAGVTISDWGDIWFRYGEPSQQIFDRIGEVCEDIIRNRSFPSFIGGDHSVTYPIVERLQRSQPLAVVWFDAHTDNDELMPGACNDHKNVARRIGQLPNVRKLIQLGHRGYTLHDKVHAEYEKTVIITTSQMRARGRASILDALPASMPCYISVDIDVLDPMYAPATSTPVPGGLAPKELKDMLRAIGLNRRVVGLDLVEVNPDRDIGPITSILACHLLLTSLGAIMANRNTDTQQEYKQQTATA